MWEEGGEGSTLDSHFFKDQECRTTSEGKPEGSSLKQILTKLIGTNSAELDSVGNYSPSDYLLGVKSDSGHLNRL